MNTARRVLKNTGALLVSGALSLVLGLACTTYLARVLGPGNFGKVNFAVAVVGYFTIVANLGLPIIGTRAVARDRGKLNDYLGIILPLRSLLAGVGFVLLAATSLVLHQPPDVLYLTLIYGLGLIPSAFFLDWAFQGLERMEFLAIGNGINAVMYLALVVAFVKGSDQLILVPVFQVLTSLAVAGTFMLLSAAKFGQPKFRVDFMIWKVFVVQAFPIGLSLMLIQVFYYIDTVMLGFMKGNEVVGYYSAPLRIILLLIMAAGAYHDAIFPVISNYYETSMDSLKRLLQLTSKLMVSVAWPLAIGGTILAKPLMHLFYGQAYDNGVVAFQILVWSAAIAWVNTTYSRSLLGVDRQKAYLKVHAIAAVVNVCLNLVLIIPFGLIGAAISRVSTEAAVSIVCYREFGRVMRVPFLQYTLRPLLASMIMALFLYVGMNTLNFNVIALVLAGMFIYFLVLFLTKSITEEEWRLVESLVFPGRK